ncbi:FimV family protein [Psychrobacter frigidicola]|uniref:type IV pilus assembly protein FimV n=1 Tax=Psychrobacter frigidicola TaxID=45611 RepID=UPI001917E609|nr:hypothetical protein [Psychrobacter frigidicola]
MSWHLSRSLTLVHYAVPIALLYSVGSIALPSVAQAATIGRTTITSVLHEPLTANITVADISAADFTVGLAHPTVYQQMGLTPTASMSVRFVPTSAHSGQVIINTFRPISKPFADVVLTLNDNGRRNVLPKTLLMPLDNRRLIESPNTMVATVQIPSLSIKNPPINKAVNSQPLIVRGSMPPPLKPANTKATNTQPLTIRRGTPPSLFTIPNASKPIQVQALPQNTTPKNKNNTILLSVNLSPISASSLGIPAAPKTAQMQASQTVSNVLVMTASTSQTSQDSSFHNNVNTDCINTLDVQALTAKNKLPTVDLLSTRTTDRSFDILTLQVTRRIQASDKNRTPILASDSPIQPSLLTNVAKVSGRQSPLLSATHLEAQLNFPIYKIVPSQQSLQTAIMNQTQQQYLKATRPHTTNQAQQIKAPNSAIGNYTQQPLLQNQKNGGA